MREKDFGYEYPISAIRNGIGTIQVRKMRKDEMPEEDSHIAYYCSIDGCIFKEGDEGFIIINN